MELTTQHNQSKILANSFRAHSEIATIEDFKADKLLAKFKALESDIVLADAMTRHQDKTVAGFIETICLIGNPKQRNSISRKLTIKDGLSLQSVEATIASSSDKLHKAQIIDDSIAASILSLCDTYGCDFKGNLEDVTDNLRNNYKYFSMLDWNLFFSYAKDGRYKTEYQNISTRGINLEFLTDWIKQYDSERDEAIASVNNDYKSYCINIPISVASEFLAKQKEVENKNKRLAELREAWSRESKFKQGKDGIDREPKLESVETALMLFSNVTKEAMKEYIYAGIDKALTERQQYAYYSTMLRRMFFKLKNADYQNLIKVFAVATNRAELADKMVIDFENKLDAAFATYRDEQIELNKDKSLAFVMTKKELGVYYALQQFKKHNLSNPLI